MTYIVYAGIFNSTECYFDDYYVERHFLGEYPDSDIANCVAEYLNYVKQYDDIFYCTCSRDIAEKIGVRNLPLN